MLTSHRGCRHPRSYPPSWLPTSTMVLPTSSYYCFSVLVLYSTVQYCYSTVLYSTVQYADTVLAFFTLTANVVQLYECLQHRHEHTHTNNKTILCVVHTKLRHDQHKRTNNSIVEHTVIQHSFRLFLYATTNNNKTHGSHSSPS